MKINYNIVKKLIPTNKIWRGLKNASYLMMGQFLTMVINFIGFIFIARLLGPSDYGIYVTIGAFVGLFDLITFRGLNKVILREGAKDLNRMVNYFEKTIGIKILFTFISIAICIISSLFMPYSFQEKVYIIIFSFSLIYTSLFGFFGTVFQAAEKMQYNAVLNIINRILFVPLAIIFLYMGFGLLTLISVALFSQLITLIINFKLTKRFLSFKFFSSIKLDITIIKPALIMTILTFSALLTSKIDLVMISWLGSAENVGIYGVSYNIVQLGLVVRNTLALSFFPIFVKIFQKKIIRWEIIFKYAFLLGLGFLILSFVGSYYSEQIVSVLFGMEYYESGVILSVLIFYLAFVFLSIPFTNTLQATHNELIIMKICWIAPTLNIAFNYLFFNIFGLIGIAYSTLLVHLVELPIFVYITWIVLRKRNTFEK